MKKQPKFKPGDLINSIYLNGGPRKIISVGTTEYLTKLIETKENHYFPIDYIDRDYIIVK